MKLSSLKHYLVGKLSKPQATSLNKATLPLQHGDKFDEVTGQVYTEYSVPVPAGSDQNWSLQQFSVREYREKEHVGYEEPQERHTPSKGARYLRDIAVDSTVDNIASIPLHILQSTPTWLVDRLWDEYVRSSRMSLEMWKVFSFLLRDRKETTLRTMRYRKSFNKPQSPLEVYTVPLISNSYDFMTYLSITTAFKLPELIKLSEIPNLAVLEIVKLRETDQLRVGDRLVRAWSIAASTEGAFKVLRILRLWYHKEITAKSLGYINAFPVLGVYDVRGCDFTGANYPGTGRLGWTTIIGEIDIRKIMAFYATAERRDKLLRDHKISPNSVRKATAEQMWDGAKVYKIRREMVPAFLVDSKESRPVERAYRPIPPSGPIPSDEFFMTMCKEKETWEFELYSAYNRLGEIREDRDLSMAGINIGDQATVGTELVNSIPLASIRLGMNPRQMPHQHRERRYTCFIRLKLPPVSEQHEKESPAVKDPAPKRKNVSGIAEGKKMKLGDVLDSFL